MKWLNTDEKELIKFLKEGKSYLEISILLNRTARSIKEKVNRLGFNSKTFSVKKENLKCLNCEKEFEIYSNNKRHKNRKFCSSSCSTTFNNKKRKDETNQKISATLKSKVKKELSNCIICGKKTKKIDSLYCSNNCHVEHRYMKYIEDWKNGVVDGLRGENGISRNIRRYLFIKYDNKCTKCGWSVKNEYTNNFPLEVEHIDGDSENNKEDNLTLLCPNCHSLTKTYKGANKGYGRYNRRERYKNGQSY
jgi:hypothetical protein